MRKATAKNGKVSVTFELPVEAASGQVVVVGDFNDWSTSAHPLKRRKNGSVSLTLRLPEGKRFHYRYLIDGSRWENDWSADDYEPNASGSHDSVVCT